MKLRNTLITGLNTLLLLAPVAQADPCGMVPPIWVGNGPPIERVGLQKTFVFHKDGVETLVLRPGFSGQVDEFGMLIPFPSPPAIRKVPDGVFGQIAAAIDPPEVVIDLRVRYEALYSMGYSAGPSADTIASTRELKEQELVVLNEEAVGMYQVAVLAAGGTQALKKWMGENGFRYPEGMDETCADYVREGWCFVAVKARVGQLSAAAAKPGMRDVDPSSPPGAGFDGHVQAMGFRFKTDELVVPMRLSAFNPGDLHNVVYALTDGPCRIAELDTEMVVRQVPGATLLANLTSPLPLRIIGGDTDDLSEWQRQGLDARRDPRPHNGVARELFATDLMAARTGQLAHPFEEYEKELLSVGEDLLLRGAEYEAVIARALADEREAIVSAALNDLTEMTMTVIDGDFPREVLARTNLTTTAFAMAGTENQRKIYDARHFGPAPAESSTLGGFWDRFEGARPEQVRHTALFVLGFAGVLLALGLAGRRRRRRLLAWATVPGLVALTVFWTPVRAHSQEASERAPRAESRLSQDQGLLSRGRLIVTLAGMPSPSVRTELQRQRDAEQNELVRVWLNAALAITATDLAELIESEAWIPTGGLERPVRLRGEALMADREALSTEQALQLLGRTGHCQRILAPALLARGFDELVNCLYKAQEDSARRLAAGLVASLGGEDLENTQLKLLSALAFHPSAETVPWRGGALYVPSVNWGTLQARMLVREFLSWMIWCDRRPGFEGEVQVLQNNLRSVGLIRVAGFQPPNSARVADWVAAYGNSYGEIELERLLAGLGSDRR